jgi:hypothetical protein
MAPFSGEVSQSCGLGRSQATGTYARSMAPEKDAKKKRRVEALGVALSGLASGDDPEAVVDKLAEFYRDNPSAGEDLVELAAEAIEESGASAFEPINYAEIRESYLPECRFSGKRQHHKSHFALTAAAMLRAGVYPDFHSEADYWGVDGSWVYSFYALVIYVRVAAERTERPVEEVARVLASRRGLKL